MSYSGINPPKAYVGWNVNEFLHLRWLDKMMIKICQIKHKGYKHLGCCYICQIFANLANHGK